MDTFAAGIRAFKDATICTLGSLLFFLMTGLGHAAERVALVVGNASYQSTLKPLQNPRNDANAMAELLREAGFRVDLQLDTSLVQLRNAVNEFGKSINDPKVDFALFYYAGHGMQHDAHNYIIPVSAAIQRATDIPQQTVDLAEVVQHMKQVPGRSYLVILDSCREDPFVGSFTPQAKGWREAKAPGGSLLAYATSPGSAAKDGSGKNGLYTGFLLRELNVRGLVLEDAFKRVGTSVRRASNEKQVPWILSSLSEDIQMFPAKLPELTESARDQKLQVETAEFLRADRSLNVQRMADFLYDHPSGNFSEKALFRWNQWAASSETDPQRAQMDRAIEAALDAARLTYQKALATEKQRLVEQALAVAREAELRRKSDEQKRIEEQLAEQQKIRLAQMESDRKQRELDDRERQQRERELAAQDQQRQAVARESELRREVERQRELAELKRAEQERVRVAALQKQRDEEDRRKLERDVELAAQAAREAQEKTVAAEREAQRLSAQAQLAKDASQALQRPTSLAASATFDGYDEFRRKYSVGDEFQLRVIDMFSKNETPLVMKVTEVNEQADRVTYNGGEFVSDLMGNTLANQRGAMGTPRQFYPAELGVGKKWSTRFKQTRPSGKIYTFEYQLRVVARERITVPAGTFDTYKIEARGFNIELGDSIERNIWVEPGINADIAHEVRVRMRKNSSDRHNTWSQNDRQELVSFVQLRR